MNGYIVKFKELATTTDAQLDRGLVVLALYDFSAADKLRLKKDQEEGQVDIGNIGHPT